MSTGRTVAGVPEWSKGQDLRRVLEKRAAKVFVATSQDSSTEHSEVVHRRQPAGRLISCGLVPSSVRIAPPALMFEKQKKIIKN
jgi:hypothetical protein